MQRIWFALPVSFALLFAGEQTWKTRKIAEWSEDDARQVLTDSPWAKAVVPTFKPRSGGGPGGGPPGGMGRGGIGLGGIGMGGPGMGPPPIPEGGRGGPRTPPALTVRWESAVTVQNAELKLRESGGPYGDVSHYAVSVVGLPNRMADDSERLKPKAEIRIKGRKSIKSADVRVIPRESGAVIVFLFPRSKEISPKDQQVEFVSQVGPMEIQQVFELSEMTYEGRLEI